MEWIRVKSEGHKHALRARQVFSQRMSRCIRVGTLETLVQVRNGESHFMDKLARDIGFSWRFCQEPKAETGGEIVKGRCGVELAASMLKSHQSSCKACRRVIDPGYTRKKRSDAKVAELPPEPSEAETTAPLQKLVDEVIDGTSPMAALIKGLEARERRAFAIAEACGAALKALQAVEASDAALKELQAQLDADRKRLAAFIGAGGGSQ